MGTMAFLFVMLLVSLASSDSTVIFGKLERIDKVLFNLDLRLTRLELMQRIDEKSPGYLEKHDRAVYTRVNLIVPSINRIGLDKKSPVNLKIRNVNVESDESRLTTPRDAEGPLARGLRVRRHVLDDFPIIAKNDTFGSGNNLDSSIESRLNTLTQQLTELQKTTAKHLQTLEISLNDVVGDSVYLKRETHALYHKIEDISKVVKDTSHENDSQYEKLFEELEKVQSKSNASVESIVQLRTTLTEYMHRVENPGPITSCVDLMQTYTKSGVYSIYIGGLWKEIYCDQETDSGGWIVFQRRIDGSENFNRDWRDYKAGFGDISKEFWLGNEWISFLTITASCELRTDMVTRVGENKHAKYNKFRVLSEQDNYRLEVDEYTGNVSDNLMYHNGMNFSTPDRDNDYNQLESCGRKWQGGWWYKDCFRVHLNGIYSATLPTENFIGRMRWGYQFLEKVVMKLRCS